MPKNESQLIRFQGEICAMNLLKLSIIYNLSK